MIVNKPWGFEDRWAVTDKYVGKILHIHGGEQLSLQYHNKKEETIKILKGEMELQIADNIILMKESDVYHIPAKVIHRMTAIIDTDVLEVSSPELEDVVRLEDSYGRIIPGK